MTTIQDTDSFFSTDSNFNSATEIWSDIKLIHESEHGWCTIYSALYRDKRVAIKALKQKYRESGLHQRLLRKEFALTSGMNHQNIASALWFENVPDIGEAILMEYIDGETLAEYIVRNPNLTNSRINNIIEQICTAIYYLHSRQTFHCDLKPANIMITPTGFVKLIDFGMSRGNGYENLDFAGGTEGFTAPENLDSHSEPTSAVDIYSIGKILKLMDRKGNLKSVWQKCLSTDPLKRPENALEIPLLIKRDFVRKRRMKIVAVASGLSLIVCGLIMFRPFSPPSPPTNHQKEITEQQERKVPVDSADYNSNEKNISFDNSKIVSPGKMQETYSGSSSESPVESIDTPDGRPFQKQLEEQFNKVVARRFNEHINLIDTMTTARSYQLQASGHWRTLVKQDMKKWLEKKLPSDAQRVEEIMKDVDGWIDFFASFSFRKYRESSARNAAAKRVPELAGTSSKSEENRK